jgi:V/A-type H+/Na+-transporting ATPase subunit F
VAFYVLGGEELVVGFRFVGVPGTVVRSPDEALAAFRSITKDGKTKVLVMTEQVAALIPHEVMDWQLGGAYPLIVEIPDVGGHVENRTSLIDSIREAVGLHV